MTRAARFLRHGISVGLYLLAGCAGGDSEGGASGGSAPERGGTLRLVGTSDIDHMSTTAAYYTVSNTLLRTFTRQLVSYPSVQDWDAHIQIAPDLAFEVPSFENGGISPDGTVYTFHLRTGVRWNTTPPREMTAADEVRGIKMLCNPVSPTGAPGYFTSTIAGMEAFCDAFAEVDGTVESIRRFVEANEISGVNAPDDSTVVFTLRQPTPDFLSILAMPFASPMPVEYLDYLPDGAEFRTHTISIGPYQIRSYVAAREISLGRNPVWDPALDPLLPAYVDSIHIVQGISAESVQQQLQAGTVDLSWDTQPPNVDLALLVASGDPKLILGPPGDHWTRNTYMPINHVSPNERGALRNPLVRQALQYAVDRMAITQVFGGPTLARPLRQAVVSDAAGYIPDFDPYPNPEDRGDPERARRLLAEAGYPQGLTLKLLYRTTGRYPDLAQTIQASLERAGIRAELIPSTGADFYSKYLQNPENAQRGVWDLALAGWVPDWYGNNGRSMIQALFDGRTIGPNSTNYGAYNSPEVNRLIDAALSAASEEESVAAWQAAATRIMEDAAVVPLSEGKEPIYHAERVRNCIFSSLSFNCDVTALWLQGGAAGR
jgi:peptide/nickel transport system substrate-binding protein